MKRTLESATDDVPTATVCPNNVCHAVELLFDDLKDWLDWAHKHRTLGPSSRKLRVLLFAARTLNATGQSRATLSLP